MPSISARRIASDTVGTPLLVPSLSSVADDPLVTTAAASTSEWVTVFALGYGTSSDFAPIGHAFTELAPASWPGQPDSVQNQDAWDQVVTPPRSAPFGAGICSLAQFSVIIGGYAIGVSDENGTGADWTLLTRSRVCLAITADPDITLLPPAGGPPYFDPDTVDYAKGTGQAFSYLADSSSWSGATEWSVLSIFWETSDAGAAITYTPSDNSTVLDQQATGAGISYAMLAKHSTDANPDTFAGTFYRGGAGVPTAGFAWWACYTPWEAGPTGGGGGIGPRPGCTRCGSSLSGTAMRVP